MKIAVPVAGGVYAEHFGGAEAFVVHEADTASGRLTGRQELPAPEHKPGAWPRWLAEQKVNAVVATAIGERALLLLGSAGIETYVGEGSTDPGELALACLRGQLVRLDRNNSQCHGHDHDHEHGHGHGHGHGDHHAHHHHPHHHT